MLMTARISLMRGEMRRFVKSPKCSPRSPSRVQLISFAFQKTTGVLRFKKCESTHQPHPSTATFKILLFEPSSDLFCFLNMPAHDLENISVLKALIRHSLRNDYFAVISRRADFGEDELVFWLFGDLLFLWQSRLWKFGNIRRTCDPWLFGIVVNNLPAIFFHLRSDVRVLHVRDVRDVRVEFRRQNTVWQTVKELNRLWLSGVCDTKLFVCFFEVLEDPETNFRIIWIDM